MRMLGSLGMLDALSQKIVQAYVTTGPCMNVVFRPWRSERLSDQGVLSIDCGMNCHKQCKDLVVFECKKHAKNSVASTENSTSVGPTFNLCSLGAKDLLHGK